MDGMGCGRTTALTMDFIVGQNRTGAMAIAPCPHSGFTRPPATLAYHLPSASILFARHRKSASLHVKPIPWACVLSLSKPIHPGRLAWSAPEETARRGPHPRHKRCSRIWNHTASSACLPPRGDQDLPTGSSVRAEYPEGRDGPLPWPSSFSRVRPFRRSPRSHISTTA